MVNRVNEGWRGLIIRWRGPVARASNCKTYRHSFVCTPNVLRRLNNDHVKVLNNKSLCCGHLFLFIPPEITFFFPAHVMENLFLLILLFLSVKPRRFCRNHACGWQRHCFESIFVDCTPWGTDYFRSQRNSGGKLFPEPWRPVVGAA